MRYLRWLRRRRSRRRLPRHMGGETGNHVFDLIRLEAERGLARAGRKRAILRSSVEQLLWAIARVVWELVALRRLLRWLARRGRRQQPAQQPLAMPLPGCWILALSQGVGFKSTYIGPFYVLGT